MQEWNFILEETSSIVFFIWLYTGSCSSPCNSLVVLKLSEVLFSIRNQSVSSMSSSSTADELLQLVPRHSPQATEHSSSIFLHVHLRDLQSLLQLQRTILIRASGAAGKSIVVGSSRPSTRVHPHCCGSNA